MPCGRGAHNGVCVGSRNVVRATTGRSQAGPNGRRADERTTLTLISAVSFSFLFRQRSQHVRADDRREPELDAAAGRPRCRAVARSTRRQGRHVPGGHQLGAVRRRGRPRGCPPAPAVGVRRVRVLRRGRPLVHRRRHRRPVPVGRLRVRGRRAPGPRMRLAGRGRAQLHRDLRQRPDAVPK